MSLLTDALTAGLGADVVFPRDPTTQDTVPVLYCTVPRDKFVEAGRLLKKAGAQLAAEWATDETPFGRGFCVYACCRLKGEYLLVKTGVPVEDPIFPSLTKKFVAAYRFERQIHSLMGLVPVGHPDLRPWIKFEDWPEEAWPLRKSFDPAQRLPRVEGDYVWARAEGEGIYEIPVGPVHAGIIEPGHFRFQAVGEAIINLEERLGYVHKGIEKRFETLGWAEGARLAGRVSGDSTVAHALTYCLALESMTGCQAPARAQWLRALFLERERISNHLGDIGAVCNDAAFALMLFQLMRLKEMLLRTNAQLFGHRFLMDLVIPGGVGNDLDHQGKEIIRAELDYLVREFERLVVIYEENPSLEDRVKETGVLSQETARELGVVGFVARASGLPLDCRIFRPFPPYEQYERLEAHVPATTAGDVHARVWVRVVEVRESIRIVLWLLDHLPTGPIVAPCPLPAPDRTGFAAVEGWRGEILYWLQAGPRGQINRCMVRDPSSLNWLGLEQAIPDNIVPDFPLCNKSFNQSYSGHDL